MSRTGEASLPMTRLTQRMDEKHEIPVDRDFHLPFSQAGIEPIWLKIRDKTRNADRDVRAQSQDQANNKKKEGVRFPCKKHFLQQNG